MADELAHYHIECKGTRDKVLCRSTLKAWEKQLGTDCPKDKEPVLFWKANSVEWLCIVPVLGAIIIVEAAHWVEMTLRSDRERAKLIGEAKCAALPISADEGCYSRLIDYERH